VNYRVLYIFVEGDDDERFFREILLPKLRKKYNDTNIIKYAQKSKKFEYTEKFIKSIQKIRDASYIYVTDINDSQYVVTKKQKIKELIKSIDYDKIFVVIKEIESWYLAGLDSKLGKNLGIKKIPHTTDTVTKEQFYNLMPKKFDSKIDFMREILKNFSIEIAKKRNKSFKYFIENVINPNFLF